MRELTRVLLSSSLVLVATAAAAQQLDFDLIFSEHPAGRWPTELRWAPTGDRLAFLWDDGRGEKLWVTVPARAEHRVLVDPSRLEGVPEDFSLASYRWSPDGSSLVIESEGDLFLVSLGDSPEAERLTETDEIEEDPKLSPSGDRLAFVRGQDLYLVELEDGTERRLTTSGIQNEVLNGTTDWVYWEEIWWRDATGYWWSPDGRRIAYYRFEEEGVGTYPLVDFLTVYPQIEDQRYPKTGTTNPAVSVGVLDLESGATVWMKTGDRRENYLARVDWTDHGERLAIQRLNRDQTELDLLDCQPDSGSCQVILTESHDTWVNLDDPDDVRFLDDGRFVWSAERDGWRQLELYSARGELVRRLSRQGVAVTSLDGIEESTGTLVYTGFDHTAPLGAAERQVFSVRLDGSDDVARTERSGWHSALVSPSGGWWAHIWSDLSTPPRQAIVDPEGREVVALPHEPPKELDLESLPRWQITTIPGPEGSRLPAALLRPRTEAPDRSGAAIMYHYGGPESQVVKDTWSSRVRALWHLMLAERGYTVLKVDNRASTFFGKPGGDLLYRRFGEHNLAAQRHGVEHLATLDGVDTERIGLWGWSGGGSNTLYCLFNSPGTWKAGVAGAPVTDWRYYDTIWSERYLDAPENNPEGYEESSAVTHAQGLEDALLVVHGTADDNVHPQNTIALSEALTQAEKPFEMAIYHGQEHHFEDPHERHFYERMTRFFERELGSGR